MKKIFSWLFSYKTMSPLRGTIVAIISFSDRAVGPAATAAKGVFSTILQDLPPTTPQSLDCATGTRATIPMATGEACTMTAAKQKNAETARLNCIVKNYDPGAKLGVWKTVLSTLGWKKRRK